MSTAIILRPTSWFKLYELNDRQKQFLYYRVKTVCNAFQQGAIKDFPKLYVEEKLIEMMNNNFKNQAYNKKIKNNRSGRNNNGRYNDEKVDDYEINDGKDNSKDNKSGENINDNKSDKDNTDEIENIEDIIEIEQRKPLSYLDDRWNQFLLYCKEIQVKQDEEFKGITDMIYYRIEISQILVRELLDLILEYVREIILD